MKAHDSITRLRHDEQKAELLAKQTCFEQRHRLRTLRVDGVDWSYIAGGEGAYTVLWLHGAMGRAYQMRRFIEPLAPEVRFIAPTLPDVATLDEVISGLEAILEYENAASMVVAGGSFGGMVAQVLAAYRAERTLGLILFDTAAADPAAAKRLRRKMSILRLLPWPLLRWIMCRSLGRLFRVDVTLTPAQTAALELARENFDRNIRALRRSTVLTHTAVAAEFFAGAWAEPSWSRPTLILRSADDPSRAGRPDLAAVYPGADVVELQATGHLGSLLRTDLYIAACRDFLDQLRQVASPGDSSHGSEGP